MNLYLVPSILSLIGNSALVVYLNVKSPKSKITYTFTILALLLVGWAFAETMMRSRPTPEAALFWSKLLYMFVFFIPSAFLALSYVYTGGKKYSYILVSYVVGLGFVPLLFSNQFVEKIVKIPPWGYDIQVGGLFTYFSVAFFFLTAVGTFVLIQYYRKSPAQEEHRLKFMMAGYLTAVLLIGITNLVSRVLNLPFPSAGSMFTLVATVSFAYGIIKYQLLIVPTREIPADTIDSRCGALCSLCSAYLDGLCPSCELGDAHTRESCPIYRCSVEKGISCNECSQLFKCNTYREYAEHCPFAVDRYGLKVRNSYLWESKEYHFALEVFRDYTRRGSFGLLITRDYPKKVVEKYQLPKVNVLWLSQVEKEGISIDPTNLPRLTHIVTQFIAQAPISFVLLIGLEYLMVHNGFDRVLKHLHMVNDQVMTHASRFLVVVDPKALDPKELSLLEREMHLLTGQPF